MMLKEKEQLNQDLIKQKKQLADYMSSPVELTPLFATWVPGDVKVCALVVIIEDIEKRETKMELIVNLKNVFVGFHYSGQEKLHPEFKVEKREDSRGGKKIEKGANKHDLWQQQQILPKIPT
ncbi:Hypothetical predicted protein [Paramuricea clavata]|uniref:Uncharacterized protein n=1 Tax=Paramuricea clavata TaxID=317549 RepID=A0A6S7HEN7_PARCT|nr:Hypothetical predicted protein [Paramuricea clavata]